MALLDSMFDPQSFSGSLPGWLQGALQGGLLGRAGIPAPTGPSNGMFGGNLPQSAMGGGYGGGVFPSQQIPPAAMQANAQAPMPPQQMPQPQMQPPQAQGPSFFDRLSAASHNLGAGGGLIPSLFDAAQGAMTGQRLDPRGMALQAQAATQQALQSSGAPSSVSQAASLNPDILKAVAPRYLGENFKVVPYGATAVNQKGEVLYKDTTGGDAILDQPTIEAMAHQYRAGDTTVMQNLGRGIQGAQNIVKLRAEIAKQNAAAGNTGEMQAMKNAEFFGVKSGQRTLGTRQANIELAATELKQVIPIVMKASEAVDRTNYPDLNKVIQAYQRGTGDPNIVRLGSGVNTLINLYSRAISPTGNPTVSDKDHAREILSQAWAKGQFNAAVDMMQQEVNAAFTSPEAVRSDMRDRFLRGQGVQAPQKHEDVPFQGAGQPQKVTTKDEYDKLPAGAQYLAPDGSLRTKR